MLRTVEAEIDIDGQVRLLEPLHITKTSRALVTLLDTDNLTINPKGNLIEMLAFLRGNRLPANARPRPEDIEAQIMEAREAWE